MNESLYQELVAASWRRRLTPAEEAQVQAYLLEHPEKQADWEDEAGLNELFRQVPEAPPVSSNFTAQVMQLVEAEERKTAQAEPVAAGGWWHWLGRWAPKLAGATLVVVCSVVGIHQYHSQQQKKVDQEMIGTIGVAMVPNAEAFQDFDMVREFPTFSDEALLAVLQK